MALPRGLVPGQGLTWVGPRLPPPEQDLIENGARGVFLDYEGDADSYVVEFNGALFCCRAVDVAPDPRTAEPVKRRHNAR